MRGADKAYRIRVGDYRVVYCVYDSYNPVLLLQIARRSETTEGLWRRTSPLPAAMSQQGCEVQLKSSSTRVCRSISR